MKDPGVFQIEEYIYLYKLIEKAGGFTEDADSEHIDRVYLVDRPQSIYIPRIGEDLDDADLSVPSIGEISAHEDVKGGNGERVDINDAGVSELSQLPGIGPKTAEKIISYRETNGRFETKEDIMKVPGIGESKFEKIKDLIFTG
ncbi:MAG: helix-hairpin-helix domain-containing protein [Clostridiales bacterium]|nr:helix-hairpin-helix domain-containing protein [Clostridiales bacterium]